MDTKRRALTPEEVDCIKSVLTQRRGREGAPLMALGEAHKVGDQLYQMSCNQQVIIYYDKTEFIGILAFDVGCMWWSDVLVLSETLVLCVSPIFKGFSRAAIATLEELACEYDVKAIVAGCIFQREPQLVANAYIKKGFTHTSPIFIKMVGETDG